LSLGKFFYGSHSTGDFSRTSSAVNDSERGESKRRTGTKKKPPQEEKLDVFRNYSAPQGKISARSSGREPSPASKTSGKKFSRTRWRAGLGTTAQHFIKKSKKKKTTRAGSMPLNARFRDDPEGEVNGDDAGEYCRGRETVRNRLAAPARRDEGKGRLQRYCRVK